MQNEILEEKLKNIFQKLGVADDEEKKNQIVEELNCLSNLIIDCYEKRQNDNRKTIKS